MTGSKLRSVSRATSIANADNKPNRTLGTKSENPSNANPQTMTSVV